MSIMNDIQSWWEIPSIVHFCKVFSQVCEDVFPINITEFEDAIEKNSYLLTNMAIRFIKICGFYDPNTNEWWKIMKEHFKKKCVIYSFQYFLDSVAYYDDLTRKQKVETLYILCHLILDVEYIQYKIANKSQLWNTLNIKPLGYDLNKSVYWYFGTTRLYREDFDNKTDLPNSLSLLNNTSTQCNTSNNFDLLKINSHKNIFTESYRSEIGSGKWNMICNDDNNSWYKIADITEHSTHANIISLHKSICNIIQTLPKVKRDKLHYKYLVSSSSLFHLKNTQTRYLRSMVNNKENKDEYFSHNINVNQTKYDPTQLNKTKNSNNKCNQNENMLQITNINRKENNEVSRKPKKTTMKLRFINVNTIKNHKQNIKNADSKNF